MENKKRLARYALHANAEISNVVYEVVKETAVVRPLKGVSNFKDYLMVIIDCKSVPAVEIEKLTPRLRDALQLNTAILLLDPKVDHKQVLGKIIGFYNILESAAFFVAPTKDLHGRQNYRIIEQAYPISNTRSVMSSVSWNALKGKMTSTTTTEELEPVELKLDAQATLAFSRALYDCLGRILRGEVLRTEVSTPPADAPYALWSYTINHNFQPVATSSSPGGFTPPTGNGVLSGTSEIGVYLDNIHVNGPFFYVSIETSALCSPNMNNNTPTNRGWALGGIEFNGGTNSGLIYSASSPNNVSGSTDYTTSSGFSVGVAAGTDGAGSNFSYSESNSVTTSIADWEILQLATNEWNFFQQSPFNGETPIDGHSWNSAIVDGEIESYPSISAGALSIETMSVWRTTGLPTGEQSIGVGWAIYPFYIYLDKSGKHWSGTCWGSSSTAPSPCLAFDQWFINYDQITWTGPDSGS